MPTVELLQEKVERTYDFRQLFFQLLRVPGNYKYFDETSKESIYVVNFDKELVKKLFPKFNKQMTVVCALYRNNILFKQVI